MKLRIRYIFILILLIIYVPFLVGFYLNYKNSLEEIRHQFETSHSNILSGIKTSISSEINKTHLLLASLSNHPNVKNKDTKYCDKLFAELKKDCTYCLNILLADTNGNNIGSALNPEEAHKLNYLDKDWFHNGLKGEFYINSPHTSKLFKEKTFMITYPVFNKGKQVAVLGIPFNLIKISEEITKNFSVSKKTNISIVNDKGIIMYNLLYPEFVGGPVKTKAVNDLIFGGEKGAKEIVGYDGLNRLFIFDTIEKIKWKVFVSIPPTELYSEGFKRIKNQLYLSFVVFLFSYILAILVTGRFAKNTEILLSAFNDLKAGKKEIKSFSTPQCYEFSELFKTFNETTVSILNYEAEIEHLNRYYHLLSEVNQKIVRYDNVELLTNDICKDIIEIGGFDFVLMGEYLIKDEQLFLKPTSFYYSEKMKNEFVTKDLTEEYLKSKIFYDVAKKRQSLTMEKLTLMEEKSLPLTTTYMPVFSGEDLYGVLVIGTKEKSSLTKNEMALFEELAGDIGFAIKTRQIKKEKENEEILLNSIFTYMGEGLLVIEKDKRIIACNKKYGEMVNSGSDVLIGHYCYETLYNIEKPCSCFNRDCMAELVFRDGKERITFLEILDKGGNKKTYSLRYNAIYENKEPKFVIVIFNDITDYKNLEQQYLHSQKLESVGRLSAGIAHDFNNILTGIIGSATIAKMSIEDQKVQNYLDTIIQLSDRAATLTKSLLTFSRKQTSNPEIVNVNEALLKSEKILKRVIGENITVKLQLTPIPTNIYIDPLQFEQIVMNLSVNAKDAISDKGGTFIIKTELIEITEDFIRAHGYGEKGEYALISFTDSGCGIPKEIIDKIFDPFFTTKESGRGTGLGLSVVYGIVKSFNGFINVYSEVGKGTTFRIYFPLQYENSEKIVKEFDATQYRNLNLHLLLVEDDKHVSEVLKVILENFGTSVEVANDGLSALEILKDKKFDIIITDIVMPKLSGIELYNRVRAFNADVKFIFISGYPYDFIEENMKENLKDMLIKPITPEKLYTKLIEAIEEKS